MKIKSQEEIALAQEKANEMIRVMYDKIENLSEYTVPLYDVIEDYFFQDVDYQRLQPNIPMWMADAGRSAESPCNRVYYDSLRRTYNDSLSNRILHWFDVQNILAAFQDRVCALIPYLEDIFKEIPAYCLYNDMDYTKRDRGQVLVPIFIISKLDKNGYVGRGGLQKKESHLSMKLFSRRTDNSLHNSQIIA